MMPKGYADASHSGSNMILYMNADITEEVPALKLYFDKECTEVVALSDMEDLEGYLNDGTLLIKPAVAGGLPIESVRPSAMSVRFGIIWIVFFSYNPNKGYTPAIIDIVVDGGTSMADAIKILEREQKL